MGLTELLRKSISFEQSKTDLTNLVNHKTDDLALVVDAIEFLMRDYHEEINVKERMIEIAEDMSEKYRTNLNSEIAACKNKIQSLIAWRAIFFTALEKR